MSDTVRNVLLRLLGDGTDAKKVLREVGGDLVKFAQTKAVAELGVSSTKAKAEIAAVKADLKGLSGHANIDLQITGAEAKIARLQARLDALGTKEVTPRISEAKGNLGRKIDAELARLATLNATKASPTIAVKNAEALARLKEIDLALEVFAARKTSKTITVKTEKARADLKLLARELDNALSGGRGRARADILRDIEQAGQAVVKLGGEATTVISKVLEGVSGVSSSLSEGLTKGLASAGSAIVSTLGTALSIIGALLAALILLGPILLSVVAALFSLVSVLAFAAAGAAALGVALLAALGPVVAVIAAVVYQITQIIGAQKKVTAATAVLKNAIISQHQAASNLAQAQKAQSEQRLAALVAEQDAIRAVTNAQNALADARLGVEGAKLTLAHAQADLQTFKSQAGPGANALFAKFKNVDTGALPGVLDAAGIGKSQANALLDYRDKLHAVKTAAQGVKDSIAGVADAVANEAKAQNTAAGFREKGLKAYAGYDSATRQVATAENALAKATTTAAEAQRKQADVLGQLSPIQAKFAADLKQLKVELTTALGPAADAVFAGISDALHGLEKLLSRGEVKAGLLEIGKAIGSVFSGLGKGLASRGAAQAFGELARAGASLVRVFGTKFLPDFLRLLLAIAHDALPALLRGGKGLAGAFHGFVDAELQGGKLTRQIQAALGALRAVGRFGGAALRVLIGLFGVSEHAGEKLLGKVTDLLNRFTDLISTAKGQASLKQFFEDSINTVRDLYHLIKDIIGLIKDVAPTVDLITGHKPKGDNSKAPGTALDTGLVSRIGQGALNILGLGKHAEGGVTTRASLGIIGEAGPEAVIPLRSDVLARLASAINAHMPQVGLRTPATPSGVHAGGDYHHHENHMPITVPGEDKWPNMGHAMAVIDQRLKRGGL